MAEFQAQLEQAVQIYRTFCDAYKAQSEATGEPADPNQPYASDYSNRDKFKQIRSELEGALAVSKNKDNAELSLWTYKFRPDTFELLILAVDLQIGLNHSNTEELTEAKRLFLSVVERIEAPCAEASVEGSLEWRLWRVLRSGLLLSTYLQLGQVTTCFGEYAEAVGYFRKAEAVYNNYALVNGEKVDIPPPYRSMDLFDEFRDAISTVLDEVEKKSRENATSDEAEAETKKKSEAETQRKIQFESNYVAALLNLARTYAKFEEPVESENSNSKLAATYCQLTLSKQLEISQRFAIAYDRLEWSLNAATLSQFYCSALQFRTAKYLLDCADSQFNSAKNSVEENEEKKARLAQSEADLARCWTKFCLSLLERSWNVLRSEATDPEAAFCSEQDAAIRFECLADLLSITKNDLEVRLVRTFDEAKRIFSFASEKLRVSEQFFTLHDQCTMHCECVQDRSILLRSLCHFVLDTSTRAKLTKRRVKLIRPLLCEHQLSPVHYQMLFRELSFELADCYVTLVDFARDKLDQAAESGKAPKSKAQLEKAAKKLNTNARCAIFFFSQFVKTYEAPDPLIGDAPKDSGPRWNISDTEWRTFLLAQVRTAQLLTKLVGQEPRDRLESTKRALDTYRLVLSFADANPKARDAIAGEYNLCVEMAGLLPAKLDKLSSACNS